jgi:uncharacterized protein
MTYPPCLADWAILLAIIVFMAIEVRLFARLFADRGVSRLSVYAYFIAYQWLLVGCVVVLWIAKERQWSDLLLGSPNPWGCGAGLVLGGAYIVLALRQRQAILNRPKLSRSARRQIAAFEPIAPHTPPERRVWTFAAITAGCCEEILFRGFLLTFVTSLAGLTAAVAANALLFGLYHAYYGWGGALKTAAFGLVLALIGLWSVSLVPVIIIHVAVDLFTGDVAYCILRKSAVTVAPSDAL